MREPWALRAVPRLEKWRLEALSLCGGGDYLLGWLLLAAIIVLSAGLLGLCSIMALFERRPNA